MRSGVARFGPFDRRAQVNLRNQLRSDTPKLPNSIPHPGGNLEGQYEFNCSGVPEDRSQVEADHGPARRRTTRRRASRA